MSLKEQVAHELDYLSEDELKKVAECLAFLKFRARRKPVPAFDEAHVAELYAEFAQEDLRLAEEGMIDYAQGLAKEDTR